MHTPSKHHHQRGSIYITIMSVAMIITIIGLGAIFARRIQLQTLQNANQLSKAQHLANSALQIAVQHINNDSNWRNNPITITNAPISNGTYSITLADPTDDDLADSNTDPVQIIATGALGLANYRLAAQLDPHPQPSTLDSTLHAAGSIIINATTLNADQPIYANGSITAALDAQIYADVKAAGAISGANYHDTIQPAANTITMPDNNLFITSLQSQATVININDIPQSDDNRLANPDFEDGFDNWAPFYDTLLPNPSPTITSTNAGVRKGSDSHVAVTDRTSPEQGLYQDITNAINQNMTVHVQAIAKCINNDVDDARIVIKVTSLLNQITYFTTSTIKISDKWKLIEGDLTLNYAGTIAHAELIVASATSLESFYVDDLVLFPIVSTTAFVIEKRTLSPEQNPFGATNSNGLYRIDCGGNDLIIRNSRIQGSILLNNPGPNTRIEGSINWQTQDTTHPALAVVGNITIATDSSPLSETTANANFNRTTPWPYNSITTNLTRHDTYPSYIQGLIYSTANITFEQNPTLQGTTIAAGNIVVQSETLTITHNPQIAKHPPAGFDNTIPLLKLANASLQREIR